MRLIKDYRMTNKLKVLVLADGLGSAYGRGTDIIFENLTKLSKMGLEITVVTTKDSFTDLTEWNSWKKKTEKKSSITIHSVDLGYISRFVHLSILVSKPLTFIKTLRLLQRESFDIIHEYSSTPLLCLRTTLLSKLSSTRSFHTVITYNNRFWASPLTGLLGRLVDKLIFTSKAYLGKYRGYINIKNTVALPLGVDTEKFKPGLPRRKNFNLPENKIVVLYLGPPEKSKGIFDLLDVIPKIILKKKDVYFLFVFFRRMSPAIYLEGIKKVKDKLNKYKEQSTLIESLVDTQALLKSVDVVVLPQITPFGTLTHPQTLLEAMATGKAVVVPNTAELKELVYDQNSFTFESGNKGSLQRALIKALNAEDTIAKSGRNHIKKNYDLKSNAERLVKLYRGALK